MLTGGNVADCTAGAILLDRLPDCDAVRADKGYDANALRQKIRGRGALANIPPKANRKWKNSFSPLLRFRPCYFGRCASYSSASLSKNTNRVSFICE